MEIIEVAIQNTYIYLILEFNLYAIYSFLKRQRKNASFRKISKGYGLCISIKTEKRFFKQILKSLGQLAIAQHQNNTLVSISPFAFVSVLKSR